MYVTDTLTFKVSAYLATLDCSSWPDRSISLRLWPESMEVIIVDGRTSVEASAETEAGGASDDGGSADDDTDCAEDVAITGGGLEYSGFVIFSCPG